MGTNGTKANTSSSDIKNTLPPGMIMGPDGKPCKVCTAFRNWKPGTAMHTEAIDKGLTSGKAKPWSSSSMSAAAMMAALASGSSSKSLHTRPDEPPPNCPPDVEQLGRATWTFLHTTAAYYPERPSQTQRANMLALLRALPPLYPCTTCASDFGDDLDRHPPDVSGRDALSRWLCERHNEVNVKLGRERFDCAKTDERWRDGPPDGRCD